MNYNKRDLALYVDFYLPRWMYINWKLGKSDKKTTFNVYYRNNPFKNGYSFLGGINSTIDYIKGLKFTESNIEYLQKQLNFEDEFKQVLRDYKFNGTMYAMEEGEVVHPNLVLARIEARIFEAKLLQTAILTLVNHESLIGTKASRIVQSAEAYGKIRNMEKRPLLLEGGSRRAHGVDAGLEGTRIAYEAGFDVSSLCMAGEMYDVPVGGTMEHADIQFHDELEAFRAFAQVFPEQCTFLVDTFDTLKSGVPNAIIVAKELEERGYKLKAIRLDSGDLAYLSKEARRMLDEAGLNYVGIVASGDLDEYEIESLAIQESEIDVFLIGTKLITAFEQPAFGAVYKIVAREGEGEEYVPLVKISSSKAKVSNPGYQTTYRIFDKKTGMAKGDYIALVDEDVKNLNNISLIDVRNEGFFNEITDFYVEELLKPVIVNGEFVKEKRNVHEIREYHKSRLDQFWPEYKRKDVPEIYPVTISKKLDNLKTDLISIKKEGIFKK